MREFSQLVRYVGRWVWQQPRPPKKPRYGLPDDPTEAQVQEALMLLKPLEPPTLERLAEIIFDRVVNDV